MTTDVELVDTCPLWFYQVLDRLPGYGVIYNSNITLDSHMMLVEDPVNTPPYTTTILERPLGTVRVSTRNLGRHIIKRNNGDVWAINDTRTALLKSDDGFVTVTTYTLPTAISGTSYRGIDIHVDNPVVWGPGGIYILNIDTGVFFNITGNLDLSGAHLDTVGILPKNIAVVS